MSKLSRELQQQGHDIVNLTLGEPDFVTPDHIPVSYTHLRAHETVLDLVCRLLLEKKKQQLMSQTIPHPCNYDYSVTCLECI